MGNIVDPWLMMDKYGVDPLRLWMFSVNQPGDSKNFDEKTVDEIVKKVINPIENIISFYFLYKDELIKQKDSSKNILDIWIINRFNDLVKNGTNHLNNFQVFESARLIRDFVNDFSTWYLRRSRDRFKSDDFLEKSQAIATTHFILMELAKYLAPFMPMLAESIFKRIKFVEDPISVHLCQFPLGGEVDREVLENMQIVRDLVSVALEKRMSAGIKVRQPLGKLKVKSEKLKNKEEYLGLIKDEVNVKEIVFDGGLVGEVELDTEITPELQNEGKVRDLVRAIQDLRKIKNLMPAEKVVLVAVTDSAGQQFLEQNKELIQKPTNVKEIIFESNGGNEVVVQDLKFALEIR